MMEILKGPDGNDSVGYSEKTPHPVILNLIQNLVF